MKKLIQILDTFSYGDAIGNHVITLKRNLEKKGILCEIYAHIIDDRVKEYAQNIDFYNEANEDVILYHLSSGADLNHRIATYRNKLVLNYHNITPPHFFKEYNKKLEQVSIEGYKDVQYLAPLVDEVIADSDYNLNELRKMGYNCEMHSIPIILNYEKYNGKIDKKVFQLKEDQFTNIIFVGRITPNKCQEDVILDFYYYQKYFNKNSRLILVGNFQHFEKYYLKLKKYVKKLKLDNVIFTGHITNAELLAYYKIADLFLCESEHEGFCVPLVEAMYFNVPICAYNSSAVGETAGDAAILLDKKNPMVMAKIMNEVIEDKKIKIEIKKNQKERLNNFNEEKITDEYIKALGLK